MCEMIIEETLTIPDQNITNILHRSLESFSKITIVRTKLAKCFFGCSVCVHNAYIVFLFDYLICFPSAKFLNSPCFSYFTLLLYYQHISSFNSTIRYHNMILPISFYFYIRTGWNTNSYGTVSSDISPYFAYTSSKTWPWHHWSMVPDYAGQRFVLKQNVIHTHTHCSLHYYSHLNGSKTEAVETKTVDSRPWEWLRLYGKFPACFRNIAERY